MTMTVLVITHTMKNSCSVRVILGDTRSYTLPKKFISKHPMSTGINSSVARLRKYGMCPNLNNNELIPELHDPSNLLIWRIIAIGWWWWWWWWWWSIFFRWTFLRMVIFLLDNHLWLTSPGIHDW